MMELFGLEISFGYGVFPGPGFKWRQSLEHLLPAGFVSGLQKGYVFMCCYLFL